jgi:hypothetical protein
MHFIAKSGEELDQDSPTNTQIRKPGGLIQLSWLVDSTCRLAMCSSAGYEIKRPDLVREDLMSKTTNTLLIYHFMSYQGVTDYSLVRL